MIREIEKQLISFIAIVFVSLYALTALVSAAQLTSGSLLLSDPRPSETGVTYTFSAAGFTTATPIECVDFVFSINPDGSGGSAGTTTGASLSSSSALTTAWTVDATTNGTIRLEDSAGAVNPNASGDVVFGGITNPATDDTFYLNVTTYSDAGCSTVVDSSRAAYATKAGEPVTLTIDPTLAFTCTPVAASQSVNGVTTTVASTASGINFGNSVTPAANGISAHDLDVETNAPNGYTVSIRHSGAFSNGTDDIDTWTGTNAAPTNFTAPGTEAWGYTTEDGALSPTADRFTTGGGDNWAGFTTSNEEVMFNDGSVQPIDDTVRVGHQVAIDSSTPAGTYQTTIVYTVASVY